MLEALITDIIIIAVPLKLTNRPLSTYNHTFLIDNGFGSRQRLLSDDFRLPSKVHSAITSIQQSHHLLLSAISFKAYSSFSTVFYYAITILQKIKFVNKKIILESGRRTPRAALSRELWFRKARTSKTAGFC